MPFLSLEFSYCGQSFLLDVAEGNMVDLNRLHEISGAPKGKEPKEWAKLPSTKNLIKSMNGGKSPVLKTKRGKGGGTQAHWQLALSYAQYLSPELHLAVNQVFKERLEEMLDPELGIKRSRERAKKAWAKQGHDKRWVATREQGIDTRNGYTDTLVTHDVRPGVEIAHCTNKIYKGIFNQDKGEIEAGLRAKNPDLPKRVNIRDHAKRSSLMAIGLAEALASEEIEDHDIRGVTNCAQVSYDKGMSVRLALNDSNSKAPQKPVERPFDHEGYKRGIALCREALKPKPKPDS